MSMSDTGFNYYSNPSAAAQTIAEYTEEHPDEPLVELHFTRPVLVTMNNHRRVSIPKGTHSLPESLANHDYVQAHVPKVPETVDPLPKSEAPFSPFTPDTAPKETQPASDSTHHDSTGAGEQQATGSEAQGTSTPQSVSQSAVSAAQSITLTGGEAKPTPQPQRSNNNRNQQRGKGKNRR